MFTIQNAVIVALLQAGVIVVGVLATGVTLKFWGESLPGEQVPIFAALLADYGFLALSIPLVWITLVMRLRRRTDISEDAKALAFWSGVVLLIALIVLIGYGTVRPWLNLDFGISDGAE